MYSFLNFASFFREIPIASCQESLTSLRLAFIINSVLG